MTIARALVWPGEFNDPDLPTVNLAYAPPLPNALYSWSADALPTGAISQWRSSVDGAVMAANDGQPHVVTSAGKRAVRFDGVDDRMAHAFALPAGHAHTIIAVFRFHQAPVANNAVLFDLVGTGAGSISTAATTLRGAGGGTFLLPDPFIPPDTSWHVALLTINGADSTFIVDGQVNKGSLNDAAREGITLGFSGGSPSRTPIDYARVEVLDGALPELAGATIVNTLRARYGI